MKKILHKKKDEKIISILDIIYDDKFTDLVTTTLVEEKMFYKLQKESIDDYIKSKTDKEWIENNQETEVISDPILGYIIKDKYGYLSTNKYLELFNKNIPINLGRNLEFPLNDFFKYKRKVFCELINKIDELSIKLKNAIHKYSKKEYKELIEYYEGEKLELVKNSLKTPDGVFNNLIELNSIYIGEKTNNYTFESKILLEFDCDWDIEHGMSILITDWEIEEISTIGDIFNFRY